MQQKDLDRGPIHIQIHLYLTDVFSLPARKNICCARHPSESDLKKKMKGTEIFFQVGVTTSKDDIEIDKYQSLSATEAFACCEHALVM